MFLVGILSWWYGKGWLGRVDMMKRRFTVLVDLFSVSLLLRTLFAPFRQISAGSTGVSLKEKIQAFFDRLISRCVGFTVRSFMILFGLVAMLAQLVFGFVVLLAWLIIPMLPIIGLVMMAIGWVPQWMA